MLRNFFKKQSTNYTPDLTPADSTLNYLLTDDFLRKIAMPKIIRSSTKKSLYLTSAAFMLLTAFVFCFVGCGMVFNESNKRLSENQIAELRQEYPICGDTSLINASMKIPTISEIKEVYDTFVYGTVKGEMSTYSKNIPPVRLEYSLG